MSIKVAIPGCTGRMGRLVTQAVNDDHTMTIHALACRPGSEWEGNTASSLDINTSSLEKSITISADLMQTVAGADVIIDFTLPTAFLDVVNAAKTHKIPLVSGTTGLSIAQMKALDTLAKSVPVFWSSNMSVGVFVVNQLSKAAAKWLGASHDIEIIEKHHNKKIDAPSGTAMTLAESICEMIQTTKATDDSNHHTAPHLVFGRSTRTKKVADTAMLASSQDIRSKSEIGMHAVRGGSIVGEHDVLFCGPSDTITIAHRAEDRRIFAEGALSAAKWLQGQPAGRYSMSDMIG